MENLTKKDKHVDKYLNIKTTGTRKSKSKDQYRYEGTPYSDLFLLFEKVKLKNTDHFVDFGSGKGRVCFYVHHLFNTHTTGIEAVLSTYHLALLNLETYNNIHNNDKIVFSKEHAENYQIKSYENIFFFFNPFTIEVFKKVINNIIYSLEEHPRDITIILTYPILEYVNFILEETDFIVDDYIEFNKKNKNKNKFIILKNIY